MSMTTPPPTDDYVARLRDAGDHAAIRALFADDGWLRARAAQSGYDGYLADMQIAWDLAAEQLLRQAEAGEEPAALLDLLRYGLIGTGMAAAANYFAPGVIARAVATGLWSPGRAISAAGLSWEPTRAFDVFDALLEHGGLSREDAATVYRLMMQAAETIDYEGARAQAFERAAKHADPETQTQSLETALAAALKAADHPDYPDRYMLLRLAEDLPDALFEKAIEGTRMLNNADARAWMLTSLARRLPERRAALIDDALKAVPAIVDATAQGMDDVMRANAIAQMADLLEGEQVTRAFEIGLTLVDEGRSWLPRAIAPLVDRLDDAQRARALAAVLLVEDEWWRKDGLLALVRHARGETQRRAFEALLTIRHGEAREAIRQALGVNANPTLIEAGVGDAEQIADVEQRAWALDLLRSLRAASKASQVDPAADTNAPSVDEQFAKTLTILWGEDRFPEFERLLPDLSPGQIRIIIEDAHGTRNEDYSRDQLLNEIAARADGELLVSMFAWAADWWQTLAECRALLNWVDELGEPFRSEAVAYVESRMKPRVHPHIRIELLQLLLPHLTGEARRARSAEALAAARAIEYAPTRAGYLSALIGVLDEADRAAAIEALYADVLTYAEFAPSSAAAQYPPAANEYGIIDRLEQVFPLLDHLQDERKAHLVARSLDLALSLGDLRWATSILAQIGRLLDTDQLARALATVNTWQDANEQAFGYVTLRPYLTAEQAATLPKTQTGGSLGRVQWLLDQAQEATGDARQARLDQALAEGKQVRPLGERRAAFIALALAGIQEALDTVMVSVSNMEEDSRWQILVQLYPRLSDQADMRRTIWRGIVTQFEIQRTGSREYMLNSFMPWAEVMSVLPPNLRGQVAPLLLEIVRDWRWA